MAKRAIVTGSAGLVGAAVSWLLCSKGMAVIGIDNDMRGQFFGPEASTRHVAELLSRDLVGYYTHLSGDIRSPDLWASIANAQIIARQGLHLIVHCASQPSHEWAAMDPLTDFDINARATLQMLEWARTCFAWVPFIYMSTNKVYGDSVNQMSYIEYDTRWEPEGCLEYGIDETWPISGSQHSLFGVSKLAGDFLVQEYGRYYDMATYCLRCGCLTGKDHKGVQQHGFLSYLAKCVKEGIPYTIFGHKGKQVRDNLHAADVADAVWEIYQDPEAGAHVYNLGGGRPNAISLLEAKRWFDKKLERKLEIDYLEQRRGDHRWWITDTRKFQADFPRWNVSRGIGYILEELACSD